MSKLFGYPEFDSNGEMILTTYDNDYSEMMMDIRVYKLKKDEKRVFMRQEEETAVLLLAGNVVYKWDDVSAEAARRDVFTEGPWCVHVCRNNAVEVTAVEDSEILVQCTHNDREFSSEFYKPEDAPWKYSCVGKFGNVAKRRVNTIFDHDISPESNMVLGEVLNDRGNWSGYLPHRHPQPETYLFKFDRPEGFGASFVGDEVFKSVNNSFSAIPGGELHPQAAAPGFQMYTCWMIRHLDGNPWLQTDRCEDERYVWLHEAQL
ncbi:MAG: 5-deoxy-glucuronate isomerase [Clostridiales bacterium]|nr:5-deoxy-glucuronate isomerase [Clostridiales bacterium]MDD7015995.1 5-deoxy-glucuronate isomerase [Bacillota bacterium]